MGQDKQRLKFDRNPKIGLDIIGTRTTYVRTDGQTDSADIVKQSYKS